MTATVRAVPVRAATATLRELVAELRGGDPLAELTVVVPSALAGATLRRGLFPSGLANVRFTSLPQYVDGVLTAAALSSGRRTGARRRALVAAALDGSPWRPPHTTGTLRLWDALLAELDEAEVTGDLGQPDVMAVHAAYRALLPEDERLLPAERAAAVLPGDGEPVVLHLPRRLTPPSSGSATPWAPGCTSSWGGPASRTPTLIRSTCSSYSVGSPTRAAPPRARASSSASTPMPRRRCGRPSARCWRTSVIRHGAPTGSPSSTSPPSLTPVSSTSS